MRQQRNGNGFDDIERGLVVFVSHGLCQRKLGCHWVLQVLPNGLNDSLPPPVRCLSCNGQVASRLNKTGIAEIKNPYNGIKFSNCCSEEVSHDYWVHRQNS